MNSLRGEIGRRLSRFAPWVILGAMLLASQDVHAQATTGQPVADVARHATKSITEAKGLLGRALAGDRAALIDLGAVYALPAALALVILIVAYMFASFAGDLVKSTLTSRLDATLGKFFGKVTKAAVMLIAALGVLDYFGIDVTSFAAVLAATGFAVGLALQGALGNFAAGVMLLVFRPFKVDDYIVVDGAEGTVDEIELFTTRLNTRDNRHMIVPNSKIFGSTIENVTHNKTRRVDVVVGVEYSADLARTRQVLTAVVGNVEGGLREPAPLVALSQLNNSSVDWTMRVWCRTSDYFAVRERLTTTAKESLDRAGIGIPFPQLDLHVITPASSRSAAA